MTDEDSPLRQYYPADFEVDANGKRNAWEAVVKIPFLDETAMLNALNSIDHQKELTPQERLRNLTGKQRRYRASPPIESEASEPTRN
jgi:5'-3' exoribonuclease 1